MKKLIVCIALLCLLAPGFGFAKGNPPAEVDVKEAAELIKKEPNLIILDVRTPAEFRQGHLPGARNMDFFGGRFDHDVKSLPSDSKVLLYCRSGKRSAGAAEILRDAGIESILHMHQGMAAWEKAGLPVEK